MKDFVSIVRNVIRHYWNEWERWLFTHSYDATRLAVKIRKKPSIKVCFIIHDLGCWKTEGLYKAMLAHPRFEPLLVFSRSHEEDDEEVVTGYLVRKGYPFERLDIATHDVARETGADIMFFQKPYGEYTECGRSAFYKNRDALYCYVNYAFHTIDEQWSLNTFFLNHAWQVYFENGLTMAGAARLMDNHAVNAVQTGLPFQDELLQDAQAYDDPWKDTGKRLKRIIWAPHHSINSENYIQYSTFLDCCDDMLALARKYSGEVQFAFKPHPLLYDKLVALWGKVRADAYYSQWEEAANCQFCPGKYMGLFKHSDAMIHDCSSFTVEYLYTLNPVIYLEKPGCDHTRGLGEFARQAYALHDKAHSIADVGRFIQNIIDGKDARRGEREAFYHSMLVPSQGASACQNIIDSILGTNENLSNHPRL